MAGERATKSRKTKRHKSNWERIIEHGYKEYKNWMIKLSYICRVQGVLFFFWEVLEHESLIK